METNYSEYNHTERMIKKERYIKEVISEEDKEEFNKLMEEYNKLVDEYNKLGEEYNKLVKEFRIKRANIIDRISKIMDKYSMEEIINKYY